MTKRERDDEKRKEGGNRPGASYLDVAKSLVVACSMNFVTLCIDVCNGEPEHAPCVPRVQLPFLLIVVLAKRPLSSVQLSRTCLMNVPPEEDKTVQCQDC